MGAPRAASAAVAYFSMEIGLSAQMATYSGGLGVLAGDTIRAAADLRVPMVAMTLLHRRGYLHQRIDQTGWQREESIAWPVEQMLEEQPPRVMVRIEDLEVQVRAWKLVVLGVTGGMVPIYFLDTDLPQNSDYHRTLTDYLYGGDERYRLCQEMVLGIGGVRMLRALGLDQIQRYHMNEGHAALLGLELLEEQARAAGRPFLLPEDVAAVRERCVFTTHTPVPAGHDQFDPQLMREVVGSRDELLGRLDWRGFIYAAGRFNMTYLALNLSRYVNGVAKRHAETSRLMFSTYEIEAITNGVHAATWVCPTMASVFDRHLRHWRRDSFELRYAISIPRDQIRRAHAGAKLALLDHVMSKTGVRMDAAALTIGFARRFTAYKRAGLLFTDRERLRAIADTAGRIQLVYAGKAHPRDEEGKRLIQRIIEWGRALGPNVRLAFLQDYDIDQAKLITSGVDVWLNTPPPPLEASGTSGMKAALNGVPSLSIPDGWWIEGAVEGITGWSIGPPPATEPDPSAKRDDQVDALALYEKLERSVLPLYYHDPEGFADVMRHAVALNGSFFNTHRMVQQYVLEAYFR